MSYILDALKKVERERARARHPLVEVAGARRAARGRLWPWAVAGALVLNATVAGVVALRWPSGPAAEPERSTAAPPEGTAATMPPAARAASSSVAAAPTRSEALTTPQRSGPAAGDPAAPPPEPIPIPPRRRPPEPPPSVPRGGIPAPRVGIPTPRVDAATPAPITTPGVDPQPAAPPPPPTEAPARAPETARARSVSDLPPAFQTAVAGLKLEVLLYGAAAADRMVFINGRKYVEGQSLDGEVVLERITADGAVLAHEGRRFLLTPSR